MSYILDALKRSEEERNRGHVPKLQTVYYENDDRHFEFLHTTTGRVLLAALVLAIAALLYSNRQPVMTAWDRVLGNTATDASDAQALQVNQASPADQVSQADQSTATPQPAPQPAPEAAPQSVPQSVPQTVVSVPEATAAVAPVQPANPTPVASGTVVNNASVTSAASRQVAESQPIQPVPAPTAQQTVGVSSQTPTIAAVSPANEAVANNAATNTRSRRDVKTKHDLPADVKRSIPKLALSVVSYAADPQKRFVMVDSEIYYEGEEMTENLIIEAITPDGPIVTWRGHEFLMQP